MLSLSASQHRGAFLEDNLLDLFLFNQNVCLPSTLEHTFSRAELERYLPQIVDDRISEISF